jgi:hypothetical protein
VYHSVLEDANLYVLLSKIDADLAAQAKACGCPVCKGRLDRADYPRKPRGELAPLGAGYEKRLSFCCAERGCRKRVTPPSVRFLGPKVYLAAVVVVVSAMRHGDSPWRMSRLREVFGVSAKTVARWRTFWQELVPASPFWRGAQGRFGRPVSAAELPVSLLERFCGEAKSRLCDLLRFLSPITSLRTLGEGFPSDSDEPQRMSADSDLPMD